MLYWYDTEFREDGKTIDLISIGIVAEDGREYYAVNAEMNVHRIYYHDWLMANVWPHLPRVESNWLGYEGRQPGELDRDHPTVKPRRRIAAEVQEFLTADLGPKERAELWAYFCAYDHVALAQLWGPMKDIPDGIPMFTGELMQLWRDSGRPTKPDKPTNAHDALADARWNKELYEACQRAQVSQRLTGRGTWTPSGLPVAPPGEVGWTAADLDRCEHGRHSIDHCPSCPGGRSTGNLFLADPPPEVLAESGTTALSRIGTTVRGEPIVVATHAGVRS